MTSTEEPPPRPTWLVITVCATWLLLGLGGSFLVRAVWFPFFSDRGIELPLVTLWTCDLASFVGSARGVLLLGALLAFAVAPAWLVPAEPDVPRWLRLLFAQAPIVAVVLWLNLALPWLQGVRAPLGARIAHGTAGSRSPHGSPTSSASWSAP